MIETKKANTKDKIGRPIRRGKDAPGWKGDSATPEAGRMRAREMYEIGDCEVCNKPATDRHHKDGNTLNNSPENIQPLCRKCHMTEDGRLNKFKSLPRLPWKEPEPCVVCRELTKVLRRGRCHKCNEFYRRNGFEWTAELADKTGRRTPDRPCSNCGKMVGEGWCKGRCPTCRLYLKKHGRERIIQIIDSRKSPV